MRSVVKQPTVIILLYNCCLVVMHIMHAHAGDPHAV
jgi:hypothetical protein